MYSKSMILGVQLGQLCTEVTQTTQMTFLEYLDKLHKDFLPK